MLLILFHVGCRSKNKFETDRYVSSDSVINNLKLLKDSELTRIEISPMIFFADTVEKGTEISGKFLVVNKGNIAFTLRKIINICDCTVSESTKKDIQPRDSAFINFKINTDNFTSGFNARTITLMGNFQPFFRVLRVECYVLDKK